MPDGRTIDYAIWLACERFKILPPGVVGKWDDMSFDAKALLLAFSEIRSREEMKLAAALAGAKVM